LNNDIKTNAQNDNQVIKLANMCKNIKIIDDSTVLNNINNSIQKFNNFNFGFDKKKLVTNNITVINNSLEEEKNAFYSLHGAAFSNRNNNIKGKNNNNSTIYDDMNSTTEMGNTHMNNFNSPNINFNINDKCNEKNLSNIENYKSTNKVTEQIQESSSSKKNAIGDQTLEKKPVSLINKFDKMIKDSKHIRKNQILDKYKAELLKSKSNPFLFE
jgi:hypothetical protein